MEGVPASEYRDLLLDPKSIKQNLEVEKNFVVLTEPRAGSEYLLRVLDQHPKICVGGTDSELGQRVGFPREVFMPYESNIEFFESHNKLMRMGCYWGFLSKWVPVVKDHHKSWCNGQVSG